jgi:hypothetical protein
MYAVLYDGTFEGFLSAVFDVYYYKFDAPQIFKEADFNGNLFETYMSFAPIRNTAPAYGPGWRKKYRPRRCNRCTKLSFRITPHRNRVASLHAIRIRQHASIETDYGNTAVLTVHQTAKKYTAKRTAWKLCTLSANRRWI